MGLPFSALSKFGFPGLTSITAGQVYDRYFQNKKTDNFKDFHIAFVEFCKNFNTILPGQDFDTPSIKDLQEFFEGWHNLEEADKKAEFIKYMTGHVTEAKVHDNIFIMAGIAAPAGAIIAKRASDGFPQMKKFKLNHIPNVVFVPMCTLFAIMGATAFQMNKMSKPKPDATA